MAVIVNITHNGGTLAGSGYTGTSGADLSVTSAARLAGTLFGLNVLIDDLTADYGYITGLNSVTGIVRLRFYIDPNTLTMAEADTFVILSCHATTGLFSFAITKTGASYYLSMWISDDVGGRGTANKVITDAPHYVEIYMTRATTDISADGAFNWWIDGVSQGLVTNLSNYDEFDKFNAVYFGGYSGLDAGTSGTLFLDELIINDDGGAIGPRASDSALGAKAFGYQFPTLGETGVSWTTFDNGSGGAITVSGNADWGKGELDIGEEMRSAVQDLGDIATRTFTLTPNRYGTGSGTATLQYRGQDAVFVQDDNVLAWTNYTVPFALSCRYFQIREIKSS